MMAPRKRREPTKISQLIDQGLLRQGIPSRRKLEELCGLSQGYIAHLIDGRIQHPPEDVLRRLALTLGQRVEEYRLALMADRHELPTPVYYFSAHLGQPVDEQTADAVMSLLENLMRHKSDD
jgi:hypothetical protein